MGTKTTIWVHHIFLPKKLKGREKGKKGERERVKEKRGRGNEREFCVKYRGVLSDGGVFTLRSLLLFFREEYARRRLYHPRAYS